ncbi:SRPBCC family protein [Streptomyces sp. NPDC056600]|uniref:SRPBCC family protein n=1 Tax=Streptomyces sp. NPDC056600 TaxID=3345874 RepID=UPI0036C41826
MNPVEPAVDTPPTRPPDARTRRWSRPGRRALAVLATLLALTAAYTAWANTHPTTLRASIEIRATPEEVWQVLTDLPAYEEWNPFITSARGTVARHASLTLLMHDRTGDTTFTPVVEVAERGRELRWLGKLGPGWIADGRHRFTIEPLGGGRVRLTQSESFTGVAVPFYRGTLRSATLPQFRALNKALAERVTTLRTR